VDTVEKSARPAKSFLNYIRERCGAGAETLATTLAPGTPENRFIHTPCPFSTD